MAEGLSTLDGEAVDIDASEAAFAAAMAAPPADKPGVAAPARKPPEPAPDPQAAPHGWTWEGGEWRPKKAAGRPKAGADKPRVTDAPAAPTKTAASPKSEPAKDYRRTIRETVEAAWFVLATTPVPDRAFGFRLGGLRTKLRVQAALLADNDEAVAGGLNTIAAHNKMVARALDRLATGEGGLWVLPATMMLAPFVAQTGQLWAGKLADSTALDAIAAKVEDDARAYVQALAEAATPQA